MITIRWFPPSWVQIQNAKSVLYIDPAYLKKYYTNHPSKIEYSTWPDDIDGLPEQLPVADIILLTHEHKDHCKKVTVNRLSDDKTRIYGPKKCHKEIGNKLNIIAPGNQIDTPNFSVTALPSYNSSHGSAGKKVHKRGFCIGYLVKAGSVAIYHPGDSSYIPEMKELGHVDIAFIPIDGSFTMGIDEAIKASVTISPRIVVPIHDMGKNDPNSFKKMLEEETDIEVRILETGESIEL